MAPSVDGLQLENWAPIQVYWNGAEPLVDWCYLGAEKFADPFFTDTIHFALQTPFNRLFRHRTPIDVLGEWHARSPGLKPTGFIFHMSRCGSTLVTQLMAGMPRNIAISEAGPIDSMARARWRAPGVSVERRIEWMRWMVSALGQRRTGAEEAYFIKFDGRSIMEIDFVREAFPDVPWIFLYREPVEVMVSNARSSSAATVPGLEGELLLGLPLDQILFMDEMEFAARVFGALCEAAGRRFPDPLGKLVNYRELPGAIWETLPRHFGIRLSAEEEAAMRQRATFHGKHRRQRFTDDAESKRSEASEEMQALAERWVRPHYRKLEELRVSL